MSTLAVEFLMMGTPPPFVGAATRRRCRRFLEKNPTLSRSAVHSSAAIAYHHEPLALPFLGSIFFIGERCKARLSAQSPIVRQRESSLMGINRTPRLGASVYCGGCSARRDHQFSSLCR